MKVVTQDRLKIDNAAQSESSPLSGLACTTIKVAHSIEEMMQSFAVRAAVFLNKQDCSYAEEFDGNDFAATHILGLRGAEPIATARIRYFAGFARLERVAVRREFRGGVAAAGIIEFVLELCRQKGYHKIQGNAEIRLLRFWERYGWRRTNAPSFVYAGHRYVEIECDLEPHPDPIAIGKNPVLFMRPEGVWDEPGPAEHTIPGPGLELAGDGRDDDDWATELRGRMERFG
ncbi:MAG: GNAT family N-acetyltransferase [Rhodospirillales bacterium]|nr:GNAT family N-acetyltransferase [Rhodospirillales bacterium]MDH3913206.1 GNAT family N-acetyltransferase [Rhodospirillales bacterium]MDH3919448.1 GNAT family N-acetyltransferase [Rhodospirillales bacterium]MDH3968030.1 GNAT family N-acetyltransferase [Rhodospirillales bacterium]